MRAILLLLFSTSLSAPLTRLPFDEAVRKKALCLDGSAPAYYYFPANTAVEPGAATKWLLYLLDGPWCWNPEDCAKQAIVVSNASSLPRFAEEDAFGVMGDEKVMTATLPLFANWHRIIVGPCDGGAFTGMKEEPVSVQHPLYAWTNITLYFRGRFVLDAVLDKAMEIGADRATDFFFTGCSTGAQAVLIQADHVGSRLPKGVNYKAWAISGWFLYANKYDGMPYLTDNFKSMYETMDMSEGLNQDCLAALPNKKLGWKCLFANYSYAHSKTPIYITNSALDQYNIANVLQVPDHTCAPSNFESLDGCEPWKRHYYDSVMGDFLKELQMIDKYWLPGEGGFINSCYEHCAGMRSKSLLRYVNGTAGSLTMAQAVEDWWIGSPEMATASTWELPCELNHASPIQCSPSCISNYSVAGGPQDTPVIVVVSLITLGFCFVGMLTVSCLFCGHMRQPNEMEEIVQLDVPSVKAHHPGAGDLSPQDRIIELVPRADGTTLAAVVSPPVVPPVDTVEFMKLKRHGRGDSNLIQVVV